MRNMQCKNNYSINDIHFKWTTSRRLVWGRYLFKQPKKYFITTMTAHNRNITAQIKPYATR